VVGRGEGGGGLTDADVEASRFQAGACGIAGVGVVAVGAVRGDQGGGVAEPEGAEGGEDDEGECVAEDPLSRRQYPGGGCVGRSRTSPIPPRTINSPPAKKYHPMLAEPLPPAPRHPISVQLRGVRDSKKPQSALVMVSEGEREDVADDLQRSRVTEGLAKFALHIVLGRKIELLEQLGGNGNAPGRPDLLQGQIFVHAAVQVPCTAISITFRALKKSSKCLDAVTYH
jgi:hypothetical protein